MVISPEEAKVAETVTARIREATIRGERIELPAFDPLHSRPSDFGALISVGIEPNDFGGTMGDLRYQFEGEEDLLHLIITRIDESSVTVAEARGVLSCLFPNLPSALVWLKPGERSHHFYIGHEALLKA
jgi:hypothetical protein